MWCFSWLDWVLSAWGKYQSGGLPLSWHHISGLWCQHDLSLLTLTLITWLKWYMLDFSIIKLLFSFSYSTFGRKFLSLGHTQGEDYLALPPGDRSIYIYYLEFFCKIDLSLSPICLFIQSFISVWTHGYLIFYLDFNSILHHLFCGLTCSRFGHSEFFHFLFFLRCTCPTHP